MEDSLDELLKPIMLTEDRLKNDEYEKQYYGFSSTELYVDFKERTSQTIKMTLLEVEAALQEAEAYDKDTSFLKIVMLHKVYMECANKSLLKFKDEARKIFAIPKSVVLDEDQIRTKQFSDKDIIKITKDVTELEAELLRERVFLAKCKQQKELIDKKYEPAYAKVESIIKSFKNLPKIMKVPENSMKLLDLQEKYVQYYFTDETKNLNLLEVEQDVLACL